MNSSTFKITVSSDPNFRGLRNLNKKTLSIFSKFTSLDMSNSFSFLSTIPRSMTFTVNCTNFHDNLRKFMIDMNNLGYSVKGSFVDLNIDIDSWDDLDQIKGLDQDNNTEMETRREDLINRLKDIAVEAIELDMLELSRNIMEGILEQQYPKE